MAKWNLKHPVHERIEKIPMHKRYFFVLWPTVIHIETDLDTRVLKKLSKEDSELLINDRIAKCKSQISMFKVQGDGWRVMDDYLDAFKPGNKNMLAAFR